MRAGSGKPLCWQKLSDWHTDESTFGFNYEHNNKCCQVPIISTAALQDDIH
jgi:hypothetical protein